MKFSSSLIVLASANDNGLAITPPLGWRSWNLYGANVNQSLIQSIMDGMVKKDRMVDGVPTSLCDLGYCDVGLDDNWQACGSPDAAPGMHYHDIDGKPLVNYQRFPDFKKMTDYAHNLKLTSGWYGNNCICSDHCKNATDCEAQIKNDVAAMTEYNFDAWKLDGCGGETNLVLFNKYIKEAGKPIMVENCHWGRVKPFKPDPTIDPAEGCPWNFYRSSGDVRASFASVMGNLKTTIPLAQGNLSYPGCWAYPDMLQVGCAHGPGGAHDPGLSPAETRTHFGSWAIVSSPLTLSHNVNDAAIMDKIWDVISNKEVIAVNQAYAGHSGSPFKESTRMVSLTDSVIDSEFNDEEPVAVPSFQYFYKPLGGGKTAVLLINTDSADVTLSVNFSDVPDACTSCKVRDIWAHKDVGTAMASWSGSVASHDCAFFVIE